MISLIKENLGKEAQITKLPGQPGDVSVTYTGISKAKWLFGYNPWVGIEDDIERFVQWYREKHK